MEDLSDKARELNVSQSSHTSASAAMMEAGLEEAFPELRSPQGRFLRPDNDEDDYNQRSPAMVAARRQREANHRAMKNVISCMALDSSERSESLSHSFANENNNGHEEGGDIEECNNKNNNDYKLHESAATLQTAASESNLLANSRIYPGCYGWKIKICCAIVGLLFYTLSIFSVGIAMGVKTAPYLEDMSPAHQVNTDGDDKDWVITDDPQYNQHPLSPLPEDDDDDNDDEEENETYDEGEAEDEQPMEYNEHPLSPGYGDNTKEGETPVVLEEHPLSPYPREP